MTASQFVAEGEAYRAAFPSSSRKRVRIYLQSLIDGGEIDARSLPGPCGPEGMLVGMSAGPLTMAWREFRRWWHRSDIDKAIAIIFGDDDDDSN
jgi:hypothetical protein